MVAGAGEALALKTTADGLDLWNEASCVSTVCSASVSAVTCWRKV